MNPKNEIKKSISKVGEAGAEVDAELGLQRSGTNPLLMWSLGKLRWKRMQTSRQLLGHPLIGRGSLGLRRGSCGDRPFAQMKRLVVPQLFSLRWRAGLPPKDERALSTPPGRDEVSEEAQAGAPAGEYRAVRCRAFGCSEDQHSDGDSGGRRVPGVGPVARAV